MKIGLDEFFVKIKQQHLKFKYETLEKSKVEIYNMSERITFYEDIMDFLVNIAFTKWNENYYGDRFEKHVKDDEFSDNFLDNLWSFYVNNYICDYEGQEKDFNRLLNTYSFFYEEKNNEQQ